ncbi:nuclear transport factor 2 family protein [Arsenicicoccus sp. oral taxon 190]|uniref:nuclear transport factor 2 family protein n=1 Tax=Arsenicicoccus sp. oral taxon 190 TaxID=1658671 RepID=UPI00067A0C6A|nr:nuclear transport factor 2 family protein [Arsenicicoccus sp. oral taxon 190]AKT51704.1 hypothetical protein ADJ73_11180 [Arsenicicoccus sp. oral taxon 190]
MSDIRSALHDLLATSEPLDAVVDRHFTDDYRQRTNGTWDDRAGFVDHIQHLGEVVRDVDITVLDEYDDGERYADRHVVEVTKRDGSTVVQEVYVLARRDTSGRFQRLEEVTLMLEGAEADRNIGSDK